MSLLGEFQQHLATLRLDGAKALVAVSGGGDSVALLDLLVRSRDVHQLGLVVAHVDHGIHPESHIIAERVGTLAAYYGLPFEVGQLRLGAGIGETVARAERYTWLEATRVRVEADLVFLGHHADDQIETVLMRVLRGSGPAGLAAMAALRGTLVRPLLPFRRSALAEHVQVAGLTVWSDPANADVRHLRSWLRAECLPVVRARVPDIDQNLLRLSAQAVRDRAAWEVVLDRWPDLSPRSEADGISLARRSLAEAGGVLAAALLQAAARRVGCHLGPARLARVEVLLRSGESGASVPLGGRWRAELSFDRLHLVATAVPERGRELEPWEIAGEAGEHVWGRWRFRWRREAAPTAQRRQAYTAWFAATSLTVRRWRSGDAVRPVGGRGRRRVTRCFQEVQVPRWRRPEWPVVAAAEATAETAGRSEPEGQIVWVPGICRSDALLPSPAILALRLDVAYV